MLFAVTVVPMGQGADIADEVTAVVQHIEDAGLSYQVNGANTVIEAGWEDVMPVLQKAESRLRERFDRVFMLITVDDHAGKDRLHGAAWEVETQLEHAIPLS